VDVDAGLDTSVRAVASRRAASRTAVAASAAIPAWGVVVEAKSWRPLPAYLRVSPIW
jgi:hypothetical protein